MSRKKVELTATAKAIIPVINQKTDELRTAINTGDLKTINEIKAWWFATTSYSTGIQIPADNWEYLCEKITYEMGTLFYKLRTLNK